MLLHLRARDRFFRLATFGINNYFRCVKSTRLRLNVIPIKMHLGYASAFHGKFSQRGK